MNAMEKMIASMIGLTPEQMGAMINDFRTMLSTLDERLATIENQQREILAHLKGETDVNGSDSNNAGE